MPKRRTVRGAVRRSLGRGDFRSVYRAGSRHATMVATVYVLPKDQRGFRIAVPVGKRIGSAVDRNRVRRRLREAFRELEKEARPGGDIIIVARTGATSASFRSVVEELRKAFQDAGMIGMFDPIGGA